MRIKIGWSLKVSGPLVSALFDIRSLFGTIGLLLISGSGLMVAVDEFETIGKSLISGV